MQMCPNYFYDFDPSGKVHTHMQKHSILPCKLYLVPTVYVIKIVCNVMYSAKSILFHDSQDFSFFKQRK